MATATQPQQCYIVDLAVTIALMESKMLSVRQYRYRNKHDEENYQLTKQKYLTLGDGQKVLS